MAGVREPAVSSPEGVVLPFRRPRHRKEHVGPPATPASPLGRSARRVPLPETPRRPRPFLGRAGGTTGPLRGGRRRGPAVPGLLNVVHQKIEEKRLRFVLIGSSARKLRRAGVNLLASRAVRRSLHPFVPEELGADFHLDRALATGTLPIIWMSDSPRDSLDAYVQMYLKEEIQAEAVTRNLPGFAHFLPIAALFHAEALNVSALARDAGVARTTAQGYLEILEDTLFTFRLPAFASRLRVREKRHPKLYWVDPGLVRALSRNRGDPDAESVGKLFEGWVAALLRAYGDYRGLFEDWTYWAPAESKSTEVDFLLRRGARARGDRGEGVASISSRVREGLTRDRRAAGRAAADRRISRNRAPRSRARHRSSAARRISPRARAGVLTLQSKTRARRPPSSGGEVRLPGTPAAIHARWKDPPEFRSASVVRVNLRRRRATIGEHGSPRARRGAKPRASAWCGARTRQCS
ncbi:MAG: uncharacterized protein QOD06_2501 [Candidatus Binatota bacterium]|nr:uncharacterized protein [Candidatus Binatota bacterium]